MGTAPVGTVVGRWIIVGTVGGRWTIVGTVVGRWAIVGTVVGRWTIVGSAWYCRREGTGSCWIEGRCCGTVP